MEFMIDLPAGFPTEFATAILIGVCGCIVASWSGHVHVQFLFKIIRACCIGAMIVGFCGVVIFWPW